MSAISSSPIGGPRAALVALPLLLELALLVREAPLLVAQVRGLLELLRLDGRLLLLADLVDLLLELAVGRRRGHGLDPHARRRLVDEVDGLVRQEAVGDVAVGEVRRGGERLVGDRDAVVGLVAVAEAAQDLLGLLLAGLVHVDLLEAPLERRVALEVLAVLVERGRADGLQLAAREGRLEDRGRVDRALGRARADEVVELVDEQDDVAALGDLLHHLLQALLELAAVLRAGDQGREVERVDLLVAQQLGHLVGGDALGQPLDDGRLAHAGLADQHRVVLGAPREDLHDPLDLVLAPDDRVELALGGELGEVAAELVEQLARLLVAALAARALPLLAPAGAGQHADDLVADLLRVGVEVGEDARRHALVLADEAEQDVLGADVVVAERQRLPQRQLEHLLRPRGERDLPGGDLLARPDDADDLGADLLHRDLEALEHAGRQALLLAQQAQEDVLGPDVVVLEGARLFLRQHDDLARALREPFEHRGSPSYSPVPEDAKSAPAGDDGRESSAGGRGAGPAETRAEVRFRGGEGHGDRFPEDGRV